MFLYNLHSLDSSLDLIEEKGVNNNNNNNNNIIIIHNIIIHNIRLRFKSTIYKAKKGLKKETNKRFVWFYLF